MKTRRAIFGALMLLPMCGPPVATNLSRDGDHRLNDSELCGGTGAIVTWPDLDAKCMTDNLIIRFPPGTDEATVTAINLAMACETSSVGPTGDTDMWGLHCQNRMHQGS